MCVCELEEVFPSRGDLFPPEDVKRCASTGRCVSFCESGEECLHGLSVCVYLPVPVTLFVRPCLFVVCVRASSSHSLVWNKMYARVN